MAAPWVLILSFFCTFLVIFVSESVSDINVHSHNEESTIPHLNGLDIHARVKARPQVLVLLHKKSCGNKCDRHINSLEDVIQEVKMMSSFKNLDVVATTDEGYMKTFAVQNNVFLAYYRDGLPIIYDEMKEEKLLHPEDVVDWISHVKTMKSSFLNDDSFEHDTQASSGSTTGDWFVMFYKSACYEKFEAKWETLTYRLHGKVVVGRVNVDENPELAKRFNINRCPTFILFRHSKMYEYTQQKYDLDSFASFATNFFKNVKAEKIPIERSPFDLITDYTVGFLKRHHGVKEKIAFAAVATLIAVVVLVKLTKSEPKIEAKNQ